MKQSIPAVTDTAAPNETGDADRVPAVDRGAVGDLVPVDRATARRHPWFGLSGWTGIAVACLALAPLLSLLNVNVADTASNPALLIGWRDFAAVPAPLQGLPAADFVIIGSCLMLAALLFFASPYAPLLFACFSVFVVLPYAGVLVYLGYVAEVATPIELLSQVNIATANVLWLPYMLWSRRIDITCRRRLSRSDPWAAPLLAETTADDASGGDDVPVDSPDQPTGPAAAPVDLPAALVDSTQSAREMGHGGKLFGWYGDGRFGGRPPSIEERNRFELELTQSIHKLAVFQKTIPASYPTSQPSKQTAV